MNTLTLSNPITNALGWTLLHAVWQGFALVLPVAILLHVLRNQSSALRYRVGVAGLLAQVLASVVTFGWLYKPATAVSAMVMTGAVPQAVPTNWQPVSQTLPLSMQLQQFLAAHLSEFVLLYFIGVAVFALRLAGGWLYLQRLSRTALTPASKQVTVLTESLRGAMQIRPVVRLRESARVAVPMVVGVLKPVLLLPIGLVTNLSMAEVEAVLAHELAHVKRHDYAVNLLQSVMEVLYFFHPALWWLSARVREEREHCCDDVAIKTIGGDGRTLATALARVEELRLAQLTSSNLTTPVLAMALTSRRQLLLHRVRRVLGVSTQPFISNGSLAGLTLATLLLLSVSVYAVQQQAQPKPKPVRKTTTTVTRENTTFSIADRKIDFVVWKGQKLPASRIAQLQKQYDRVMAGQLNLDTVEQPDRDILLQLIEATYSSDRGVKKLNEKLTQVNHENTHNSLSADVQVELTDSVNVNGTWVQAYKSYQTDGEARTRGIGYVTDSPIVADSTIEPSIFDVVRRQDMLADLQDSNKEKEALLNVQAQIQEFAVDAVNRKIERLERQKYILNRKRLFETTRQQQAIAESGFAESDSIRRVLVKRIELGETTIQVVETEIEKLDQQLIATQVELENAQKLLRQTETESRKLRTSEYEAFTNPNEQPHSPRPSRTIRGTATIEPVAPTKPPIPRVVPIKPTQPVKPAPKP